MKSLLLMATLWSAVMMTDATAAPNHTVLAISNGPAIEESWNGIHGPVDRLILLADNNDIACHPITIRYASDGATKAIFSGMLYRGDEQIVAFPAKKLRDIRFYCTAENAGRAKLDVTAGFRPLRGPAGQSR